MRDLVLLRFTLHAIRDLGAGVARVVPVSPGGRAWHAGPQPLNDQAMQDLIGDGWLRPSPDGQELRLDAWPTFAGINCDDWLSQHMTTDRNNGPPVPSEVTAGQGGHPGIRG